MTAYDRTDSVLDAIDATLEHAYADDTVSENAMRWTPDPPPEVATRPEVDALIARWQAGELTDEDVQRIAATVKAMVEALRLAAQAWRRAMAELPRSFRQVRVQTRQDFTLAPSVEYATRWRCALEAKQGRRTGPTPDRLDGRRTRR